MHSFQGQLALLTGVISALALPAYGAPRGLEIVVPAAARSRFHSGQALTRTLEHGECVTNCGVGFFATKKWHIRKDAHTGAYWIAQGEKKIGPFDRVFAPFGQSGRGPSGAGGIVDALWQRLQGTNHVPLGTDMRYLIVEKIGKLYLADIHGMNQLAAGSPGFELIEQAVEHKETIPYENVAPALAVDPSVMLVVHSLNKLTDERLVVLKDRKRFLLDGRTGLPTRPDTRSLTIETALREYDPTDWRTP